MARMTTARVIVRSLVTNGVDTVFGLPGVQLDALFNALHDERNRIRVIHPRHEQAAAYMALGYAQASGGVGAYPILADARLALEALAGALERLAGKRASGAEEIDGIKLAARREMQAKASAQIEFLDALRTALPEDGIFVDEMTQVGYVAQSAFAVHAPRTYISISSSWRRASARPGFVWTPPRRCGMPSQRRGGGAYRRSSTSLSAGSRIPSTPCCRPGRCVRGRRMSGIVRTIAVRRWSVDTQAGRRERTPGPTQPSGTTRIRPAALHPPYLRPRTVVGLTLLAGILALPWAVYAQSLTVSSWGGPYGESQRRAYSEPFTAATGIRVVEDDWGGDLDKVRAMVATGRYRSHVLDAESSDVAEGCAEGILEPIDHARLGLSTQDMLPGAILKCGVGNVAWSMVLVFDRARLGDDGPEDWADFFDVTRFQGGRGLRRGALGNLEIALMADGVAPEAVYALLRTPEGTDRAFAKLATLAPNATWWEAGRQPARLLDDGDAVMTTAWNGRVEQAVSLRHRPYEIVWRGQILDYGYWSVPKDHPRTDLAYRFLAFAIRPDRQAELARRIPYGPLRRAAFAHLDPDRARRLPTAPENLDRWLKLDPDFWLDRREALERRFGLLMSRYR